LDFTYPKTLLGAPDEFQTITLDEAKFSISNIKCYLNRFNIISTTNLAVVPALEFNSACPLIHDTSIACREIKVFTDSARTGAGNYMTY
jgi:hypothetical protein